MNNRGFSLVEVLIAALVMGIIALSIIGLFVQGAKGIKVGKTITDASSAGDHIIGQLNSIRRDRTYKIIGATDTDTGKQEWVYNAGDGEDGYPAVYNDDNFPSGDKAIIESIGEHIDKLNSGKLTYSVEPLADIAESEGVFGTPGTDLPDDPQLGDAIGLKVSIVVEWKEQKRDLQVNFETVR